LQSLSFRAIPRNYAQLRQKIKFCPFLGPNYKILPQGKSPKQELIPESNEINFLEAI